eukprot:Gb_13550 [translate_table: standard]
MVFNAGFSYQGQWHSREVALLFKSLINAEHWVIQSAYGSLTGSTDGSSNSVRVDRWRYSASKRRNKRERASEQTTPGFSCSSLDSALAMANNHSSFGCLLNTMDTESCYPEQCAQEFHEMSSKNAFGGPRRTVVGHMDAAFASFACSEPAFAAKSLQNPSFSCIMTGDNLLDACKFSYEGSAEMNGNASFLSNPVQFHRPGLQNAINLQSGWSNLDASKLGVDVSKLVPSSLAPFPSNPCLVERGGKISSFGNGINVENESNPSGNVTHAVSNLQPAVEKGPEHQENKSERLCDFSEQAKCANDVLGKRRKIERGPKVLTAAKNTKTYSHGTELQESEENKAKRCKDGENSESENENGNSSESSSKKGKEKYSKFCQRDDNYIHVRARRGQATDSHSLAERVRREKINERMKFLQDLVPSCNKVTGKAVMLDEIINYVQSLQHQVEFLSMKLATVNPKLDFNIDNFFAKEMCGNFTSKGVSPSYVHLDPLQREVLSSGSDIPSAMSSVDSAEMLAGANFQGQSPSGWESDLQSMFNMGLVQSRLQHHQAQ